MCFQIGQEVFVVAYLFENAANFTTTRFPEPRENKKLLKCYFKKLTVTEHHKVQLCGSQGISLRTHDGYVTVDEDLVVYNNQFPIGGYVAPLVPADFMFSIDMKTLKPCDTNAQIPFNYEELIVNLEQLDRYPDYYLSDSGDQSTGSPLKYRAQVYQAFLSAFPNYQLNSEVSYQRNRVTTTKLTIAKTFSERNSRDS